VRAHQRAELGVSSVRFTNDPSSPTGLPDPVNWDAWQHDPCELPVSTLQFLLASRYCEVDSELMQFAWNQFGNTPMGWGRVQAICDFVHNHLRFDYQLRARRAPRSTASRAAPACAATSRTWRSRCAAA
jgi:transglutaminase-like putative cysteine protease